MSFLDKAAAYTRAKMAMDAGVYPYFPVFTDTEAGSVVIDGRSVVMFGSNGYTSLAGDPRVKAAAKEAIDRYGTSVSGSRLLNGNSALHIQLEEELADYFGYPAALVMGTGYMTNLGTLSALLRRERVDRPRIVFLDEEAHASMVDGARLGSASSAQIHANADRSERQIRRFTHNDLDALAGQLHRLRSDTDVLVAVDGVYSMSGDLAPLPDLVELCRVYGATLLVDDAHGAGVLSDGRGTCHQFGLTSDDIDVLTLTFSKAFASAGGAVLGDETLIHYLRHNARALMFSAALPPADTAAALAALRILREEPQHGRRALELAATARTELTRLGYPVRGDLTPIVTVNVPDDLSVFLACHELLANNIYVNPVVSPAASPSLRISFTAAHSLEQLEHLLGAFTDLAATGLIPTHTDSAHNAIPAAAAAAST